jgi:hypothetical protein
MHNTVVSLIFAMNRGRGSSAVIVEEIDVGFATPNMTMLLTFLRTLHDWVHFVMRLSVSGTPDKTSVSGTPDGADLRFRIDRRV